MVLFATPGMLHSGLICSTFHTYNVRTVVGNVQKMGRWGRKSCNSSWILRSGNSRQQNFERRKEGSVSRKPLLICVGGV